MKRYALALAIFAFGTPGITAEPAASPATGRLGMGYLKPGPMPESLLLSPAPPATGSTAQARDDEGAAAAIALRGSARWVLATSDADLFGPGATNALSCAAGVAIGAGTTPKLEQILRKVVPDLGMSTAAIKQKFGRPRPFMVNGQPTCTPEGEPMLRKDGSYPSGHSAIGYGWGLIVAQLLPDRAAPIVARGRAFGDSRRICNVHWLSDTEEGRIAAAATVARLNADPAFQKDMKAARKELQRVKTLPRNCEGEAAALAL